MKTWWYLLIAAVVLGSSLLAFGIVEGTLASACVFMLAYYIRYSRRWSRLKHFCVFALIFAGLLALLLPAGPAAREAALRATCISNLKQIAAGLRSYQKQYGFLPPPCTYDETGRPMHSWRVLLLPFFEEGEYRDLYKHYELSQPWDSPHNRKLLESRPSLYACPAEHLLPPGPGGLAASPAATCYLAVTGAQAAWQRDTTTSLNDRDLKEKAAHTVLVLEAAHSNIGWLEPRDLSLDDLPARMENAHMLHQGYFFRETPQGAEVLLADGNAELLPTGNLVGSRLKRVLEVGGFRAENMDVSGSKLHLNWPHSFGLPIWLAASGALLYAALRGRKPAWLRAPEEVP
jgi:hypothetical protein